MPEKVQNVAGVGQCRIAHPNPNQSIFLYHRVPAHLGLGWNPILPRYIDAGAGGIKLQSVVHATYAVALTPSRAQRRRAMAASVFKRHQLPRSISIKKHGFIANGSGEQGLAVNVGIPPSHVPTIFNKHV
jgi:hypothetical protein